MTRPVRPNPTLEATDVSQGPTGLLRIRYRCGEEDVFNETPASSYALVCEHLSKHGFGGWRHLGIGLVLNMGEVARVSFHEAAK